MRWTMSRATLTTISRPVPPRNAVICERDVQPRADRGRDDRDDAEERGADVGHAHHHLLEVVGRPLARAQARDEAAVVAELVGHLLRLELDGGPEVGEEVDHHDLGHDVDERARG